MSMKIIIVGANFSKWDSVLRRMIRMMSGQRLGYSSGRSSNWLCRRRWCILRAGGSVVRRLSVSTTGEEASIPREMLVIQVDVIACLFNMVDDFEAIVVNFLFFLVIDLGFCHVEV